MSLPISESARSRRGGEVPVPDPTIQTQAEVLINRGMVWYFIKIVRWETVMFKEDYNWLCLGVRADPRFCLFVVIRLWIWNLR